MIRTITINYRSSEEGHREAHANEAELDYRASPGTASFSLEFFRVEIWEGVNGGFGGRSGECVSGMNVRAESASSATEVGGEERLLRRRHARCPLQGTADWAI